MMMNEILREFLHKFVIIYIDDVFIFNRALEEHMEHLRLVLQRSNEDGLKLHLKKCFLYIEKWSI
jgi:hypothetical protein